MSAFTELMRRRHTVRSYAPMPVEREKLRAVLEAGRWAPTAVNAQPQRILVLDTPERLAKVRAAPACGTPDPAPACGTPDPAPACGTPDPAE